MDFYKNRQSSGSLLKSMFRKVFITETTKEIMLTNLCKNLFKEIEIEREYKHCQFILCFGLFRGFLNILIFGF